VAHVWAVDERGRKIFVAIATERDAPEEPLLEDRDFTHEFEQHIRAFRLRPLKAAAAVAEPLPPADAEASEGHPAEPRREASGRPAQEPPAD
jgi:hypothetical protein